MRSDNHSDLLDTIGGEGTPDFEQFRNLVNELDDHRIVAKAWLLEGTPHVFRPNNMKYVIFREHVASCFDVGSQDVCIVGSAKLGFSPSPHRYGKPFEQTSDVDVAIISEEMFDQGTRELFSTVNQFGPSLYEMRSSGNRQKGGDQEKPTVSVNVDDWKTVKEAIRNFVFQNFNPGLLPDNNALKNRIFDRISSTSGLFLALEPRVFVSKIRCRFFRTWKAAEDYYTNSLRELKRGSKDGDSIDLESTDSVAIDNSAALNRQ